MASPVIQTSSEHASGNVFTKPTGLADNDVLYILYWSFHANIGTVASPPSGFTTVARIGGDVGFGSEGCAAIFRKVITSAAGEGASYTVSRTGMGTIYADGGEIFRVSGVDTAAPEDDSGTNNATSTSPSTGANITTTDDSLLLAIFHTAGEDPSTPSGMTSQFFHDTDVEGFSESVTGTLTGATRSSTIGSSQKWLVSWCAVATSGGGGGGPTVKNLAALGVG